MLTEAEKKMLKKGPLQIVEEKVWHNGSYYMCQLGITREYFVGDVLSAEYKGGEIRVCVEWAPKKGDAEKFTTLSSVKWEDYVNFLSEFDIKVELTPEKRIYESYSHYDRRQEADTTSELLVGIVNSHDVQKKWWAGLLMGAKIPNHHFDCLKYIEAKSEDLTWNTVIKTVSIEEDYNILDFVEDMNFPEELKD